MISNVFGFSNDHRCAARSHDIEYRGHQVLASEELVGDGRFLYFAILVVDPCGPDLAVELFDVIIRDVVCAAVDLESFSSDFDGTPTGERLRHRNQSRRFGILADLNDSSCAIVRL